MYEQFFGLTSKPFQLNPDPSFYFDSKPHRRAKAYLDYGVQRNEGFIVITGEVGAGKTTVLAGLLNGLDVDDVVVGNLVTTQLDAEDTLRMVAAAFGCRVVGASKAEVLIALESFLLGHVSKGRRCLLVVDEAQNLTPRAIEELRMLSNYQLGTQSLLQSFLVGQPEFRQILQRPEMEQFRQRIAATCHIGPLDLQDTRSYIEHRLRRAGSTDKPSIEVEAFKAVYEASQGIPRRINFVCDRLLLLGFLNARTHLTVSDVNEVVREFAGENSGTVAGPVGLGTPQGIDAGNPDVSADIARQLAGLTATQHRDRLERIEESLMRLERVNMQTLAYLQRVVGAKGTPQGGGSERSSNGDPKRAHDRR